MKFFVMSTLLGWSVLASAEIYQWTDRAGNVHFGDRAAKAGEPGLKAEKLDIKETSQEIDVDAERNRQQLRLLNQKNSAQREADAQHTAQLQQQEQQLRWQCKAVRDSMRAEESSAYLFRYDDAGKRVIWTVEERNSYRAQLQEQKQRYCGTE